MAVSLDLGSAMVVAGAGQQSFLELSSWLTENDSSETDERAPWNTTSTVSQTTPGSSNNEDPSFNCEYRWYNLCPTHTGPYPQASDGSSEEFVLRLDQMQSFWMQAGWLLMSFVGAGCFCFLLRCFVLARARFVKGHSQLKDFGYYTPERERYLEYFLGVLTMICFAIFADETCELGEGHRFFEEVHPFDRWVEVLAASMMFFCFCLRLYYSDLHGPCPCLMNFLTSPLMYFDLLAMAPTLTELILQESGIFPNLVWLRFPRLLDTALKDGSGGEGIGVIAKLVSANWSILKIPAHLLCAVWFACSSIHYLTECENEEFVWGVEPGYHRYISIPSAMYYALIDFNGEFPNADEFSAPFGRMNSMVICLLGTYLLSIPAGVLGAAFHDHVTRNHGRLDAVGRMQALEARPPPSKSFSVMLIGFVVLSTGNFILLTVVYQRPVCENDVEGHLFEEGSWQRATIAPCRYLDCLLAIPFFTIWAAKLVTIERARDYILSASHAVDLAAWLPSYFLLQSLVLHGSCLEHTGSDRQASLAKTQLAFHGMCMFRWLKLDCVFGRMFKQLQFTLAENKVIFRMSLICAATLWLLGSVLMYYAERDNPDEGTRDHFKTLPLSFWMTALDFTSEAPINDHGAQGKAVHTIIMLLGVGLFTVPMGLFASAFRERLDEMHAKTLRPLLHGTRSERLSHGRRVSETAMVLAKEQFNSMIAAFSQLEQERELGIFRDIHDVDDKHLMQLKPATPRYQCYRLLMGFRHPGNGPSARWLQNLIIINTLWCCFTSCVETLPYFDACGENTVDFDTGLGIVLPAGQCRSYGKCLASSAVFSMLGFLAEFAARFACHPKQSSLLLHPASVADLLVLLGSFPVTLAYLAGAEISYKVLNTARVLRLWRLLALERFVPAFQDVLQVIMSRGYQVVNVCYVLLCFWFLMTTYNWYFLHSEFQLKSEEKTFACWYSNYWFAMQFSLIHMSGDYPMTEYPVKVRAMHICSLFVAWAFVTMPVAMLAAAFHDALEKRRLVAAKRRHEAMCKIVRMLRRVILRRRFRHVVDTAFAEHQQQFTRVGVARRKYPGLAQLLGFLNSNEKYLFVLGVATAMHVALAMMRSIPEFRPEAGAWDVVMLPLVTFFLLNFLGRAVTAFMNPLCQCSTRRFLCSGQRCLQLMAFILYFAHLVYPSERRLLRWSCAAQIALIVNFGQILGTSCLLSLVWSEIRESLLVMTFISGTFWALSATLWYLSEEGREGTGMNDMFSTLYYTCIFLLGEWCSFDFSPMGAGLSMLYAIVGVGLNAMPMAAVQDALTNLTDSGAYDVVLERRKLMQSCSNLSNASSAPAEAKPGAWKPRKTEIEMQILDSLDQPID